MPQTIGQETVLKLLSGTAEDYDQMVEISTLGFDSEWKSKVIAKMEQPEHVLDLACGTGILTYMALREFPDIQVTGVDLQEDYLDIARQRATVRGLDAQTRFHRTAVEDFDGVESGYDHIISCYLPKYADLEILVARLLQWSAPGARIILHDFSHPTDADVERNLERHYERWIQRAARQYPHWITCFRDLYDVVRSSDWTLRLPALLNEAGFLDVDAETLNHGCATIVTARAPE